MMLEIKKYPDSILKKKAKPIQKITPEIKKLAEDMVETLQKTEAVGLAASQVGVLKRMIVVQSEKGPAIFLNPKIIKKSLETEKSEEGCLSLPGIWLKIKRAKEIELEALDIQGKKVQIKAEGLLARICQHEIDHLDGILIIDKLNFIQRHKIKKQLKQ